MTSLPGWSPQEGLAVSGRATQRRSTKLPVVSGVASSAFVGSPAAEIHHISLVVGVEYSNRTRAAACAVYLSRERAHNLQVPDGCSVLYRQGQEWRSISSFRVAVNEVQVFVTGTTHDIRYSKHAWTWSPQIWLMCADVPDQGH